MRAAACALVALAAGVAAAPADARAVRVGTDAQLAAAVHALRGAGGTIVLRPRRFDRMTIGPRSARRLRIVARPGASARTVRLVGTRAVTIDGLAVTPRGGDAVLAVVRSRGIVLSRLRVTAGRSRHTARIRLSRADGVRIARSRLSRCGDGTACILLGVSSRVAIVDGVFHDCFGCDFVRGRFGTSLVVRGNRFDRAVPGRCGTDPKACNHQDLLQVEGGRGLVVERNRFGVYEFGAGQLFLRGPLDGAVVRTNVFLRSDPLMPGLEAAAGIVVGSNRETVMPRGVVIAGNTILSGAWRPPGIESSVILSAHYADVPVEERPVVVNNVLGLAATPERLCAYARATIANVILAGTGCSESDVVGEALLDPGGLALDAASLVVDRADPAWATTHDFRGVPRDEHPDVGAFEFVAER